MRSAPSRIIIRKYKAEQFQNNELLRKKRSSMAKRLVSTIESMDTKIDTLKFILKI